MNMMTQKHAFSGNISQFYYIFLFILNKTEVIYSMLIDRLSKEHNYFLCLDDGC